MSAAAFTPGPWHVDGDFIVNLKPRIYNAERLVAEVGNAEHMAEGRWHADARLIAAAPELFEALEYMADLFKDRAADPSADDGWYSEECRDVWLQARAALAKALGEPR